jgi:hypothetical protein
MDNSDVKMTESIKKELKIENIDFKNSNLSLNMAINLSKSEIKAKSSGFTIKEIEKENEDKLSLSMCRGELLRQQIMEEQSKIQFEPFKLNFSTIPQLPSINENKNLTDFELMLVNKEIASEPDKENFNDSILQSVLRRQSLFKLREKMNGKVSKQISEIEKRKLSPFRFCNSPLKSKKQFKETTGYSINNASKSSPLRVPSIFCKRVLKENLHDQYVLKKGITLREHSNLNNDEDRVSKLSTTIASYSSSSASKSPSQSKKGMETICESKESPLIVRAASHFYKKLNRNRSVKRLNSTYQSHLSNKTSNDKSPDKSSRNQSQSSPIATNMLSTELSVADGTIDL